MNYRFLDFFRFCNVFRSFHTVLAYVGCMFVASSLNLFWFWYSDSENPKRVDVRSIEQVRVWFNFDAHERWSSLYVVSRCSNPHSLGIIYFFRNNNYYRQVKLVYLSASFFRWIKVYVCVFYTVKQGWKWLRKNIGFWIFNNITKTQKSKI